MKYQATLLAVKNIERSKKFYCELFGQKIVEDYGINIAFDGGIALQQEFDQLLGISKDGIAEKSNNMELYFEEENLDGFIDILKEYPEIEYVHGIKEHDWKQRVIRIYDPDYHIIEVGEPMKSVVKRLLKEGYTIEETAEITQQSLELVYECMQDLTRNL